MIGKTLAHYEIESRLGAGGMGEVFQARDTKLGRRVAVKVLPDVFAQDADRIARFQREAKVLASLNHANIAALHAVEESEHTHFLVMELVEGETLAERIARGPIPVEDALKIAHQITEALEFAHEKNIIHRDLKPSNVKLTPDGKVKVLDFGLAKALAPPAVHSNIMSSPTLSVAGTMAGVILGTAPYMSPEQAKGFEADQRSDIFSFGAVLYEMLTGRQSFQGDTVTDVIASVLARQPDLAVLPANLNPRLEDLVRRCLEKNPKRRWQAIGDARVEIEAIMADPHGAKLSALVVERPPLWKRAIPVVITAIVVASGMAALMWNRPTAKSGVVTRFPFLIPDGQRFIRTGRHLIAISPDGTNIVYGANNQLYLRTMAEMESRPIQGTAVDVDTPFFSPDGRWVAFHSNSENTFKKIAITGGASVAICDGQIPFGASWAADDRILIGAGPAGILRVSANGGKPETVVPVKGGEVAHGPQLLPGGQAILFTLATGASGDRWDRAQIVLHLLKSGERKVLIEGGSDARYVPTGHIVYALGSTLLAVPFDLNKLQVTGGPVPIIEGMLRVGALGTTGAAQFGFSDNGSMVFIPGAAGSSIAGRILALVDRSGARKLLPIPPATYFHPRISPNGKQLVVSTDDRKDVIVWVYDLGGTTSMRRLTFEGANRYPIWTRDGQRVVFQSDREGDAALFWQRADGSGSAERLTKSEQKQNSAHTPDSWSPDGKTLTFSVGNDAIWSVSTERDAKPKVLIDAPTNQNNSSISPDGLWIAYQSTESGPPAIYVQPFPPTGAKFQITTTPGGILPVWSPDGKQIFYVENAGAIGRIMSVDVQTQPSFTFGKPTPLPIEGIIQNGGSGLPRGYDITPDGKQFVVMLPANQADTNARQTQRIDITLNWFEELKQRVGKQ